MVQGLSDFFKATPPKTFNILCKTVTCYTGWLSIRLHRVHTSLDEYPDPFASGAVSARGLLDQDPDC